MWYIQFQLAIVHGPARTSASLQLLKCTLVAYAYLGGHFRGTIRMQSVESTNRKSAQLHETL